MNKILPVLLLALTCSCSLGIKKSASEKVFIPYGYDFTEYANKGFLFTPLELIDRPYEGRGIIRIDGFPQVKLVTEYVELTPGKVEAKEAFKPGKVEPAELIKQAYELALSMGADAIISFRISSRKGNSSGNVEVDIQEISGFAIKRL